jgi:signal transduction histidine kinase
MPPRADRLFRCAGVAAALWASVPPLLACWVLGVEGLAASVNKPPDAELRLAFSVLLAVSMAFAVTVPPVFWWLTGAPRPPRRVGLRLAAVIVQGLIGVVGDPNLLILVAAEVPFVLAAPRARRYLLAQLAAFATLGILWNTLLEATPPLEITMIVSLYGAWQVAAFLLGTIAVREAAQRRELTHLNAELGATRELLAEGSRLSERIHLSRELHDGLGHRLAALSVHLDLAARTAGANGAETVREAHAEARRLYQEVRDVVSTLRHEASVDVRQALSALVAGFTDPLVELDLPAELTLDDLPRAQALLKCVRSAMTHARQAQATRVRVAATQDAAGLQVEIRDDRPRRNDADVQRERSHLAGHLGEVEGCIELPPAMAAGLVLTLCFPHPEAAR